MIEHARPAAEDDDLDPLISGYLDDSLEDRDVKRLESRLCNHPAAAERLARAALLHDRLHDLWAAESAARERPAIIEPRDALARRSRGRLLAWAGAAAVLAVLLAVRQPWADAAAAGVELDRLIATAADSTVRQYQIRVVDATEAEGHRSVEPGGGRKPDVDGATVTLRGPAAFVLVRRFSDGTPFITGSDGHIGWSVPPGGAVHASHDPRRFRRGLPGERDDIPFVCLPEGLRSLRQDYALSLSDVEATGAGGAQELVAVRRSRRGSGPQRVSIMLSAAGMPGRIRLEGLPVDNGNPREAGSAGTRTVELELVGMPSVGPDFFTHDAHHGPEREVRWE